LFSRSVTRTSAFLLQAVNCLACVDCLWRGVGYLRLQPCSEVAVRLTSLMWFHSLYVAWSFAADSTNKFNRVFIRSHQGFEQLLAQQAGELWPLATMAMVTFCWTWIFSQFLFEP